MSPLTLREPLRSLYAKIFLWFCATVLVTILVVLAVASLTESQPFGRRWMAITQDLYAHSAVDFFRSGGAPALTQYLADIERSSGIHGQLVDEASLNPAAPAPAASAPAAPAHDVLAQPLRPETDAVLAQARRTHESVFHLGLTWTSASPVLDPASGASYIFLITVNPGHNFTHGAPISGTFVGTLLPRVLLGTLLVALFCLALARHITRPIRILEDAATQLAAGQLGVRAAPRVLALNPYRRDELTRMALAFDRMADRIQSLLLAQQEMLGHISHELRSPLTRIGVSLELLRRTQPALAQPGPQGHPDADFQPTPNLELDQMQLDLDRLNQMIGEILQITRMDLQSQNLQSQNLQSQAVRTRHPLHPSLSPIDLVPLLQSITQDAAFEAQPLHKPVRFELLPPVSDLPGQPAASCLVLGDAAQLRSCMENVVRNALLYTPDHTPITIRLIPDVSARTAIVLIQDEGPGVPPDALPHLFELFYRVTSASTRHPEGTGFGLAIAQRIVTLHGGSISARNRTPHGLEIGITLPLA